MEISKLKRLGFTANEAKVYITLLQHGKTLAGAVSKRASLNRTSTYDCLERLLDKGIITYVVLNNRKVFSALPPKKLVERQKEQQRIAAELLPELTSLQQGPAVDEEFKVYKGKSGIKSILHDILKHKEHIAFGSSGKFLEIMKHDFLAFQQRKRESGIKARIITGASKQATDTVKKAYARFRFIPDAFASPTTIFVYGDTSAIIIWNQAPLALAMSSREAAESFRHYFELIWKEARDEGKKID